MARRSTLFSLSLTDLRTGLCSLVSAALVYIPLVSASQDFQLSDQCPPSFLRTDNNRCELRNLYQLYDSLGDRGVGGLKTALPTHRDGFSPQQIDLMALVRNRLISGGCFFLIRCYRQTTASPVPAATIPARALAMVGPAVLASMVNAAAALHRASGTARFSTRSSGTLALTASKNRR